MIAIYGIKSCDTCRKARKWLDGEGIAHEFSDVRADGLEGATLDAWIAALGWEALLNRREVAEQYLDSSVVFVPPVSSFLGS